MVCNQSNEMTSKQKQFLVCILGSGWLWSFELHVVSKFIVHNFKFDQIKQKRSVLQVV